MVDWILGWWAIHPTEWGAHPYAIAPGILAAAVTTGVLALVFWIKGKFWP